MVGDGYLVSVRVTSQTEEVRIPSNASENPEWLGGVTGRYLFEAVLSINISSCPYLSKQTDIPRTVSPFMLPFAPQNTERAVTMKSFLTLLPFFGSLVSASPYVPGTFAPSLPCDCPLVNCINTDAAVSRISLSVHSTDYLTRL